MKVVLFADVQKFPLRMKDNDLLVTELYRDPTEDAITALSVYLTPKTSKDRQNLHFNRTGTKRRWPRSWLKGPTAVFRRQRELDRDRVRNQFWDGPGHRSASRDGRVRTPALPDLLCPPQPRDQDHAV